MAGNFFQAFATGAATTLTENIKREEKNARELAASQAAMLIDNHNRVRDARDKQAGKMIEDVKFLQSQFPAISNDDLVMAATNPSAIAALKTRAGQPDWSPKTIKFSDFAELTSVKTGFGVEKLVNDLFDKSVVEKAAVEESNKKRSFIQAITAGTQEQALKGIVAPLGYDVEKLKADMGRKPQVPEGKVKFNLGVLAVPDYDKDRKRVMSNMQKAQESGDPEAIKEASIALASFVVTDSLVRTESLSDPQIQSNLVTQIQEEKDPNKKAALEAKLKDRQERLASNKKPSEPEIRTNLVNEILKAKKAGDTKQVALLTGELKQREQLLDKKETNVEKISAANYISAATKGVASAVQDVMTPGSFITVTNADGSTSIQPKDLASEKLYRKGVENGRKAVIAQMTNQDGKPKSDLDKMALISIGVVFDQNGVARLPAASGAPPAETPVVTPAPAAPALAPAPAKPAAAPAPSKPAAAPAPASAPAFKPLPSGTKRATMEEVNRYAIAQKLTPAQVITKLKNNGYTIVD